MKFGKNVCKALPEYLCKFQNKILHDIQITSNLLMHSVVGKGGRYRHKARILHWGPRKLMTFFSRRPQKLSCRVAHRTLLVERPVLLY